MQYKRGICDGKNEESVSKNIVCVCHWKATAKERKVEKKRPTFFSFRKFMEVQN